MGMTPPEAMACRLFPRQANKTFSAKSGSKLLAK